jgi:outer membrane receptor protein involved in Fe transport
MRNMLVAILLALAGLGVTVEQALAQTETGKITGTVRDPQGAVIPGVTVTVRNLATESIRTAMTDSAGNYVISNVLPANYEVSFELSGFKKMTHQARVAVGSEVTVDAGLEVGNLSEVVSVTASVVDPIDLRTAEVKSTVVESQIKQLPTITRDPYDLIAVAGNVNDQDPTIYGGDTPRGIRGFSINGLRATSANALLDGSANNDEFTGSVGQSVPLDAVQEFSVISSNFSAQYGRATAGVVNVVTKAGTNEFHGSAYEFFRNETMATRTVDQKAREIEKSPFERHQPGFSIGGPVRRNQMQFFGSMEYTRVRSDATDITLVPTPEFLARTAASTQSFFSNYSLATPATSNVITRGEIAGTPGGPFSALPANLPIFAEVRRPIPIDAGGGLPQDTVQFVGRLDWTLGSNMTAYARYAIEHQDFLVGSNANSPYKGFDTGETENNHNALFSLTRIWSPSLTSQSKIAFSRPKDVQPLGDAPVGPTLYARATPTTVRGLRIAFPGYVPFSPGTAIPFGGPQKLFQLYHDMNWVRGAHDLRLGGSYVRIMDDRTFGAYQESVETLGASLAQAMDNLVLGQLLRFEGAVDPQGKFPGDTITLPVTAPNFTRNNRYNEFAGYFNDAWKMHPTVTVNLGVRYEFYGVQQNKDPQLDSNFYYGSGANIWEQIRNGSVQIAPDSPAKGLWRPDKNNFAPRLGFAWDVRGDGRTAIRGGYGMAFERNFGNVTFNVIQNPPNYAVVALNAGTDVPVIPITNDNAGPLAGTGTKVLPGTSLRHVDENIVNAYAHFWSASFEHQLPMNTVVSVDYTGSAGEDQYTVERANIPGSAAAYLNSPSPTARLNTQYTTINSRKNNGKTRYHGVTFGFDNRSLAQTGLSFTTKYTLSRAKDDLSSTFSESSNNLNLGALDPYNVDLDYGYADYDVRHRFSSGIIWDIPAGRNSTGAMRQIVNGWQANVLLTARTGAPFSIYDCTNTVTQCMRMIQVSAMPTKGPRNPTATGDPNSYQYLDLSGQASAVGSYVNAKTGTSDFGPFPSNMTKRNAFRRPGAWNADAVFAKRFTIGSSSVQARFEFYNLFAHANLFVDGDGADISATNIITAFYGKKADLDGAPQGDGQRRMQFGIRFDF